MDKADNVEVGNVDDMMGKIPNENFTDKTLVIDDIAQQIYN